MANVVFLRGDRELVIQQMAAPEEQPSVLRRFDAATGRQLGRSLRVRPCARFHLSGDRGPAGCSWRRPGATRRS